MSARSKVILIYRDVKTCTELCVIKSVCIADATVCTSCTAGKFSTAVGATSVATCSNCDAGKYSAGAAGVDSVYVVCVAAGAEYSLCVSQLGNYSGAGASVCTACAAGKYTMYVGTRPPSVFCTSCPKGKTSVPGSVSQMDCETCLDCILDNLGAPSSNQTIVEGFTPPLWLHTL